MGGEKEKNDGSYRPSGSRLKGCSCLKGAPGGKSCRCFSCTGESENDAPEVRG